MNRLLISWKRNVAHLWLGLSALLLVTLLFCSPALVPTAHAARANVQVSAQPDTSSHCSSLGSLIESDGIYYGSTKIGELDVYFNSSTGYNCAYTYSSGPSWGVKKAMAVYLYSCEETSPASYCHIINTDADDWYYSYYAGPAGVYARGHCISFFGYINWEGQAEFAGNYPKASHCG